MVNTPFRIGVLGAPSTGATQLLRRIEMELRGHGVAVARTGGIAKRAAAAGLPKMQHHTDTSTEWIIGQTIADEALAARTAQVVLADRAVLDAIPYYTAALEYRDDDRVATETCLIARRYTTVKYHVLLATVLDPEIPVDAAHPIDPRYRALVDSHLHDELGTSFLAHSTRRVTSTADSKDAAVQHAVDAALRAVAA
ncbi:AAA family ATPase [Streptomyces catenulae]|uniref:AAA family ATPase n=1 Tax=Streptomyces catenulae TaxID=66875 RepID=A0ABV2Z2G3_9ACTN|nr:AAA family ATPase [Streptomyces catenulae]